MSEAEANAQEWVTVLLPFTGRTLGSQVRNVTLLAPPVAVGDAVRLRVRLMRDGAVVPLVLPLYIVNPPVLVVDSATGNVRKSVLEAAEQVLTDLAI